MSQVIHKVTQLVSSPRSLENKTYMSTLLEMNAIQGITNAGKEGMSKGQRGSKFKVVHYCELFFRAVCLVTCDS